MKNFGKIAVIGLSRENAWAIPYSAKKEDTSKTSNKKKQQHQDSRMKQEEIYENGLDEIEKIEKVHTEEVELKRMSNDKNEMKELIQSYFDIEQFVQEEEKQQQQNEVVRSRKITTRNVFTQSQLQEYQSQYKDALLFWESKQQLMQLDFNKLVFNYLYLKTSGHPLICLSLIQNLIT